MAKKISISNIFKVLSQKYGDELELDDEEKEVPEKVETTEVEKDNASNKALSVEKERNEVRKMTLPKYNTQSGLFEGLDNVEDAELKELFKTVNTNVKNQNRARVIDKVITEKLGTVKLIDGISSETVKRLIDISKVTVNNDGTVTGVDETFAEFQKNNVGLFKAEEKVEVKAQESSPLLEGFNPQNSTINANDIPNSFSEAFAMMTNNNT